MQIKGYQPVLAHPKRYPYFRSAEEYDDLHTMCCALQLNFLSLTGYYSKPVQSAAKTLLQHDLADFLATDLHHVRHVEQLQQALSHELVVKALQTNSFQNQEITGA